MENSNQNVIDVNDEINNRQNFNMDQFDAKAEIQDPMAGIDMKKIVDNMVSEDTMMQVEEKKVLNEIENEQKINNKAEDIEPNNANILNEKPEGDQTGIGQMFMDNNKNYNPLSFLEENVASGNLSYDIKSIYISPYLVDEANSTMHFRFNNVNFIDKNNLKIVFIIQNKNNQNWIQLDGTVHNLIKSIKWTNMHNTIEEIKDYGEIANILNDFVFFSNNVDENRYKEIENPLKVGTDELIIPPNFLGTHLTFNPPQNEFDYFKCREILNGKLSFIPTNELRIEIPLYSLVFGRKYLQESNKVDTFPIFMFSDLELIIEVNTSAFFVPVFDAKIQDLVNTSILDDEYQTIKTMAQAQKRVKKASFKGKNADFISFHPKSYTNEYNTKIKGVFETNDCLFDSFSILIGDDTSRSTDLRKIAAFEITKDPDYFYNYLIRFLSDVSINYSNWDIPEEQKNELIQIDLFLENEWETYKKNEVEDYIEFKKAKNEAFTKKKNLIEGIYEKVVKEYTKSIVSGQAMGGYAEILAISNYYKRPTEIYIQVDNKFKFYSIIGSNHLGDVFRLLFTPPDKKREIGHFSPLVWVDNAQLNAIKFQNLTFTPSDFFNLQKTKDLELNIFKGNFNSYTELIDWSAIFKLVDIYGPYITFQILKTSMDDMLDSDMLISNSESFPLLLEQKKTSDLVKFFKTDVSLKNMNQVKSIYDLKRYRIDLEKFHEKIIGLLVDQNNLVETKNFEFFKDSKNIEEIFTPFNPYKFVIKPVTDVNIVIESNDANIKRSFFTLVYNFMYEYPGTKAEEIIKLAAEIMSGLFFFEFNQKNNLITYLKHLFMKIFYNQAGLAIKICQKSDDLIKLFDFSDWGNLSKEHIIKKISEITQSINFPFPTPDMSIELFFKEFNVNWKSFQSIFTDGYQYMVCRDTNEEIFQRKTFNGFIFYLFDINKLENFYYNVQKTNLGQEESLDILFKRGQIYNTEFLKKLQTYFEPNIVFDILSKYVKNMFALSDKNLFVNLLKSQNYDQILNLIQPEFLRNIGTFERIQNFNPFSVQETVHDLIKKDLSHFDLKKQQKITDMIKSNKLYKMGAKLLKSALGLNVSDDSLNELVFSADLTEIYFKLEKLMEYEKRFNAEFTFDKITLFYNDDYIDFLKYQKDSLLRGTSLGIDTVNPREIEIYDPSLVIDTIQYLQGGKRDFIGNGEWINTISNDFIKKTKNISLQEDKYDGVNLLQTKEFSCGKNLSWIYYIDKSCRGVFLNENYKKEDVKPIENESNKKTIANVPHLLNRNVILYNVLFELNKLKKYLSSYQIQIFEDFFNNEEYQLLINSPIDQFKNEEKRFLNEFIYKIIEKICPLIELNVITRSRQIRNLHSITYRFSIQIETFLKTMREFFKKTNDEISAQIDVGISSFVIPLKLYDFIIDVFYDKEITLLHNNNPITSTVNYLRAYIATDYYLRNYIKDNRLQEKFKFFLFYCYLHNIYKTNNSSKDSKNIYDPSESGNYNPFQSVEKFIQEIENFDVYLNLEIEKIIQLIQSEAIQNNNLKLEDFNIVRDFFSAQEKYMRVDFNDAVNKFHREVGNHVVENHDFIILKRKINSIFFEIFSNLEITLNNKIVIALEVDKNINDGLKRKVNYNDMFKEIKIESIESLDVTRLLSSVTSRSQYASFTVDDLDISAIYKFKNCVMLLAQIKMLLDNFNKNLSGLGDYLNKTFTSIVDNVSQEIYLSTYKETIGLYEKDLKIFINELKDYSNNKDNIAVEEFWDINPEKGVLKLMKIFEKYILIIINVLKAQTIKNQKIYSLSLNLFKKVSTNDISDNKRFVLDFEGPNIKKMLGSMIVTKNNQLFNYDAIIDRGEEIKFVDPGTRYSFNVINALEQVAFDANDFFTQDMMNDIARCVTKTLFLNAFFSKYEMRTSLISYYINSESFTENDIFNAWNREELENIIGYYQGIEVRNVDIQRLFYQILVNLNFKISEQKNIKDLIFSRYSLFNDCISNFNKISLIYQLQKGEVSIRDENILYIKNVLSNIQVDSIKGLSFKNIASNKKNFLKEVISFRVFQVVNDNELCCDPIGLIFHYQKPNIEKWTLFNEVIRNLLSFKYTINTNTNFIERKTEKFLLFLAISSMSYNTLLAIHKLFKKEDISSLKLYSTDIAYSIKCLNECNGTVNKINEIKSKINREIISKWGTMINNVTPSKKNAEIQVDVISGIQTFIVNELIDMEYKIRSLGSDEVIEKIRTVVENEFKKIKQNNIVFQDQKNYEDLSNLLNRNRNIQISRNFTIKSCFIDLKDVSLKSNMVPGQSDFSIESLKQNFIDSKFSINARKFEIIKKEAFFVKPPLEQIINIPYESVNNIFQYFNHKLEKICETYRASTRYNCQVNNFGAIYMNTKYPNEFIKSKVSNSSECGPYLALLSNAVNLNQSAINKFNFSLNSSTTEFISKKIYGLKTKCSLFEFTDKTNYIFDFRFGYKKEILAKPIFCFNIADIQNKTGQSGSNEIKIYYESDLEYNEVTDTIPEALHEVVTLIDYNLNIDIN